MDVLDPGKRGDADLEVGRVTFDHREEEGKGDGHHIDLDGGDPF
jgi:hypothetical protein